MSDAPRTEPEWVQRMRAAGYNVRIGTGEGTVSEIPDAYLYPPPTRWSRMRRSILRACRKLVRTLTAARRTSHAPFP